MNESLEQRLRGLFVLQNIDVQLDELEAMKGDLPKEVAVLEERLGASKEQLKKFRSGLVQATVDRDKADVEVISHGERVEKLKDQQYKVRSNKEYDALTREIAHAETSIEKFEKEMEDLESRMKIVKEDIDKTEKEIEELERLLKEKRAELEEVSAMNQDEELKLQHERDKVLVRVEKTDLATYNLIRNAKGGLAVVSVRRGSCGGCHNRIPPQRLLELRQHKKIYKCEHCGRVLVSDEIVNTSTIPT